MAQAVVTDRPVPAAAPSPAPRRDRWAWFGPLAVALFAGLLRFWNLSYPNAFVFDETYYPKDAWSLLHQGYEGVWPDTANTDILDVPQIVPLSPAPSSSPTRRSASGSSRSASGRSACTRSAGG